MAIKGDCTAVSLKSDQGKNNDWESISNLNQKCVLLKHHLSLKKTKPRLNHSHDSNQLKKAIKIDQKVQENLPQDLKGH